MQIAKNHVYIEKWRFKQIKQRPIFPLVELYLRNVHHFSIIKSFIVHQLAGRNTSLLDVVWLDVYRLFQLVPRLIIWKVKVRRYMLTYYKSFVVLLYYETFMLLIFKLFNFGIQFLFLLTLTNIVAFI